MAKVEKADVGSYRGTGGEYEFRKDFFRQGMVFKSWDNYENNKDLPCYSSENSENDYWTARDFLSIAGGNQRIADQLFDEVDWQCPETLFDEWLYSGTVIDDGDTYRFDDEEGGL